MQPQSLQQPHLDFFAERGYLRLEAFHPRARVDRILRAILDELRRRRIWASGKTLSSHLRDLPPFQQTARLSTLVAVPGLQEVLLTPQLSAAVARLAHGARMAAPAAQLLLSLPYQGAWTLDRLNWHVDAGAAPQGQLPGIQAFFLLDDVAPAGGATLALAGSHRVATGRTEGRPPLRELLKGPAFPQASLQEMGIELVEMCGCGGDVFLMDMRVLHTPSINAGRNVRMMATARFLLAR